MLTSVIWFGLGIPAGAVLYARWLRFKNELKQITERRARKGAIPATRREERRNANERLRLRATMQHNWYRRGDPRGIYGDYPPVPAVPVRERGTAGLPQTQLAQ